MGKMTPISLKFVFLMQVVNLTGNLSCKLWIEDLVISFLLEMPACQFVMCAHKAAVDRFSLTIYFPELGNYQAYSSLYFQIVL